MLVKLTEASLADTHRLYQYKLNQSYEITFDIKGFDYGWILSSREWKKGEKVLDVGGAYSSFPNHLNEKFGCETWVADDFGMSVDDPFWTRNRSPHEHIAQHPETRYILERLGDVEHSTLPEHYFDVIYSASALEHVPAALTPAVWKHMLKLIKPGGQLIHAMDILFPSNGGMKKMIQASIFDSFPWLFSKTFRQAHYLATPANYTRVVCEALGVTQLPDLRQLSNWKMCLDPEILCEPIAAGWNRITKDKIENYHYQKIGNLLLQFTVE